MDLADFELDFLVRRVEALLLREPVKVKRESRRTDLVVLHLQIVVKANVEVAFFGVFDEADELLPLCF